jgi:hypothetical protein
VGIGQAAVNYPVSEEGAFISRHQQNLKEKIIVLFGTQIDGKVDS